MGREKRMFPGWTSNVFGERMFDRVEWLSLRTYCEEKIRTVMHDSISMKLKPRSSCFDIDFAIHNG